MPTAQLTPMSLPDYYILHQRSMSHPNITIEGITGLEPDGVWWNPSELFDLPDGAKIDADDFNNLYYGYSPITEEPLTEYAAEHDHPPGIDLTLAADKSVSSFWAIAEGQNHDDVERAHIDAVRDALQLTIARYCAHSQTARDYDDFPPADIFAGLWPHQQNEAGNPHLHTHCTLLNIARSHENRQFYELHMPPIHHWVNASGAVYTNRIAWLLRERLGIRMERYGETGVRIANMPNIPAWDR